MTIVSYKPNIYKYVIQATSPTFKLQRINLPNKTITQPINENKRTVFEEFIKILEVYGDFGYNGNLESLLDVPCPEMSFTKSTLHEVLIALFGVCGLAPKMTDFRTIDYIDLKSNDNNNWNSEEVFIRFEKNNSLENYSDCLDYDVENAISDINVVSTQWLASTSEEVLISDDNFIWKTPTDIYEIVNVKLRAENEFLVETKNTDNPITLGLHELDITDYVVPKEIYETLLTSSEAVQKDKNYKRNNLYYENNVIGGGGFSESSWIANLATQKALFNIIDLVLEYRGYILVEKETDLRKY
jgi:hypothetical protein